MKKIISIVLALMLMASLSVAVFAAEETGSITINGVSTSTNTYEIYKLLDLESYDLAAGAYSYTVNAAWAGFFATDEAKAYMTVAEDGYVTWTTTEDDDTKANFAKLALAYAKANDIAPVQSSDNDGEFVIDGTTGKFSNLELGYYLVDSTVGALCGLTTTNPDASINAKNGIPTIDKQVQEDSTQQWGDSSTADIGQIVNFRVTINVHAGAESYVIHDAMSEGLTFKEITEVQHIVPGTGTHTVEASKYTLVTEGLTDGCDFELKFSDEVCNELETNDKLVVYYTALLNRNATIAGEGNKNVAWLAFGEGNTSNEDDITTYTFGIDVVKTDSANKLISGAEFKIYDAAVGGNEVAVVLMDDGVTYRRAREDETGIPIVVDGGMVRVNGLDNGTYYLEETVAPDGYNKLTSRQKFIISDANLDATFNGEIFSSGSGVHVVNKTGSMLPETGGLGVLLFTVLGGGTAVGTGAVLVTKKRMSKIEDED